MECDFEKLALKFPIPIVWTWQAAENAKFFLWENAWKSVRNYMEVIENILRYQKKTQKSQTDRWVIFRPQCQLQLSGSQIGFCKLSPVLLECTTYTGLETWLNKKSKIFSHWENELVNMTLRHSKAPHGVLYTFSIHSAYVQFLLSDWLATMRS